VRDEERRREGERWKRNIKKWGSPRERERGRENERTCACARACARAQAHRHARTLPAHSLSLSLSLSHCLYTGPDARRRPSSSTTTHRIVMRDRDTRRVFPPPRGKPSRGRLAASSRENAAS